jgi:hypothetical protein
MCRQKFGQLLLEEFKVAINFSLNCISIHIHASLGWIIDSGGALLKVAFEIERPT